MNKIEKQINELFAQIEQDRVDVEIEQAQADPKANRLTKCFLDGAGYYFFESKNGRGQNVRHCYSTKRNAAGYLLTRS